MLAIYDFDRVEIRWLPAAAGEVIRQRNRRVAIFPFYYFDKVCGSYIATSSRVIGR